MKDYQEEEKMVIILDGLKFEWKESALKRAVELWNEGYSGMQIASYFRINQLESLLLIAHLSFEGMIEERPGGWIGV